MRILVLGGTGFIGASLTARLLADGCECVTISRGRAFPASTQHLRVDVSKAVRPDDWVEALEGIDAVVNAAGTLQAGGGRSLAGVHVTGIDALYKACEVLGVRRVVHLSAIGVDRAAPSEFSVTKRKGEAALMKSDLEWVVLRPSVVIGCSAYGGSALLRGLAALPVLPVLPGAASIQPVWLDDVLDTILFFLKQDAPTRKAVDLVGPRQMEFAEAVGIFRRWLRYPPQRLLAWPRLAARMLFLAGDLAHALGWRAPVNSTAQAEMLRGATGDPTPWQRITGIVPRDVETALMSKPAPVQERWFSRLYVLKPLLFLVFGLFWIVTGLISMGPGWEHGMALLREGGIGERMGMITVAAGALADLAIGFAILYRPWSRYGLWAALIVSLIYVVIGTALVPRLWSDPLGPMLKIWPVLVLNLIAMAIREDR